MLFNRNSPQAASEAIQHLGASVVDHMGDGQAEAAEQALERRVIEVPNSLVSAHANWKPAGVWTGRFDLAVWFRLPQGCPVPVQLVLRYTDQRGEHSVLVDTCKAGEFKSALLNGNVEMTITGRVKDMALYLTDLPKGLPVGLEEWHFQPQIRR